MQIFAEGKGDYVADKFPYYVMIKRFIGDTENQKYAYNTVILFPLLRLRNVSCVSLKTCGLFSGLFVHFWDVVGMEIWLRPGNIEYILVCIQKCELSCSSQNKDRRITTYSRYKLSQCPLSEMYTTNGDQSETAETHYL